VRPSPDRWTDEPVTADPGPPPRRRRVQSGHQPNHERWLVSYADFITLLFAVFATMYALSVVDAKKFSQIAQSLREAFRTTQSVNTGAGAGIALDPGSADRMDMGALAPALTPSAARPEPAARMTPPGPDAAGGLGEVKAQLQRRLAGAIAANQVAVEVDPRGLVVSIREAGAFAASRADLSDAAQAILAEVGGALAAIANHVRIEGHTDDVPIHTDRFESNWELSTTRATTVVRFFVDRAGLRPDRLSAAGYGEYFPRAPNTSEANRVRNRRVDIVILTQATRASEEPAAVVGPAAPGGVPPTR
jgi:chemotaxis protein MotB